jgi:hypothetical protein
MSQREQNSQAQIDLIIFSIRWEWLAHRQTFLTEINPSTKAPHLSPKMAPARQPVLFSLRSAL